MSEERQKSKDPAVKAWNKLLTEEMRDAIKALPNHKESDDWLKEKGKYVPYPASWLNGKMWNDELEDVQPQGRYDNT